MRVGSPREALLYSPFAALYPKPACVQPSSQLMLPDPAEMLNGVGETLPGEQRRLTPSSIDRRCVAMVRGKGELAVVKRGQALGMPYRKLRAVVRYAHFRAGASEWQRRLNPGVRAQLRIRPPLFSCSSAQVFPKAAKRFIVTAR